MIIIHSLELTLQQQIGSDHVYATLSKQSSQFAKKNVNCLLTFSRSPNKGALRSFGKEIQTQNCIF